MTTEKHLKASMNMVIFLAMVELIINSYFNTKIIKGFDSSIMNKIRNLKPLLERQLKDGVLYIETGGPEVIELYHEITQVFEDILVATQRGDAAYFEGLMKIIKAYNQGDVKVYETLNEAIAEAEEKKSLSLQIQDYNTPPSAMGKAFK